MSNIAISQRISGQSFSRDIMKTQIIAQAGGRGFFSPSSPHHYGMWVRTGRFTEPAELEPDNH
jgi:hypothetical protein